MVKTNWLACCILPVMLWGCDRPVETEDLVVGGAAIAVPAGSSMISGSAVGTGAGVAGAGVAAGAGVGAGAIVVATAETTDGAVIETHGATTPERCRALANRFREWGRNVQLKEIRKNTIGSGGVLEWECRFAGPDAEVGYDGFNENYNNGEIAND